LVSEAAQVTRGTKTRLLVNDRADIAAGAGAHGVHLTTQSLNAATIRKAFGDNFLIGASTHSLDDARQARDEVRFCGLRPSLSNGIQTGLWSAKGDWCILVGRAQLIGFPLLALGGI
jgi:thiamine monophosphate synthase